jgi:hypothetical protein
MLKADHSHPSLQFKKVGKVWSARIGSHYRAVATSIDGGFLWVWIGTHADYDKLLAQHGRYSDYQGNVAVLVS